MSTFIIKIISMVTMFGDHLSKAIYGINGTTFLNYIGRFAFILFCFQLVLGYNKTRSLRKYLLRLIVLAIISQIPYSLFFNNFNCEKSLNIVFTLLTGLISISILNIHRDKNNKFTFRDINYNAFKIESFKSIIGLIFKLIIIFSICLFVSYSTVLFGYWFEYNYQGVIFIITMYLFYPFDNKYNFSKFILYIISIILFGFVEAEQWFGIQNYELPKFYNMDAFKIYINIYISCIIGGFLPLLYNGKKGKSIKLMTYLFYPIHFLILYIIYIFIN